jgi:hypothetical protein
LAAVVIAAAIGGALADSAPTGGETIDLIERTLAAAVVTIAGAGSRRLYLIVFATLPTMLASPPWLFVGIAAIVIVIAELALRRGPEPIVGAIVAGLSVQVALRLGDVGVTGLTALVGIGSGALLVGSAIQQRAPRPRRIAWAGVGLGAAIVLVIGGFTLAGAVKAAPRADDAFALSNHGLRLARDGDVEGARPLLEEAGASLALAGVELDGWWSGPASALPIVAQHQRAAVELSAAGGELTSLAGDVTSLVDSDALRGEDGRIDLDQIRSLQEPTRRAQEDVDRTLEVAASVRSPWLVGLLQDRIEDLEERLNDVQPSTDLAADVVDLLPGLLGADGQRSYFLMLLTPSEARELGGLSGSWAQIGVDDGQIELEDRGRSDDLVELDMRLDDTYPASYRESLPGPNPQNYSSTPDMAVATRGADELYRAAKGRAVDGVISVDTDALAAVIELTGPIAVPGYPFVLTPENTRQFLLYDQYDVFPNRDERGDYLNALIDATFQQLTDGELPRPEALLATLGPLVEEDHIRMLTFDESENDLFERLGLDGRLEVAEGSDVVGVFHSNTGQNKLDAYLERSVDHDVEIDWDAQSVSSTLTVTLSSTAPTDGKPSIVVANRNGHPPGTNSSNLFILTPLEVDAISVDGEEQETWVSQEEGALHRRGLPVVIPPGATVTVQFALSGPLDMEEGYRLTMLHQPVVVNDQLSLAVADTDGVVWLEQPDGDAETEPERPRTVSRTFETLFLAEG